MAPVRKKDITQYGKSELIAESKLQTPHIIMYKKDSKRVDGQSITHRNCVCVDCQKSFECETVDKSTSWYSSNDDTEVACPDCGVVEKPFSVLTAPTQKFGTIVVNAAKKEMLYCSRSSDGQLTKVDDVTLYDNIRIYSSGKIFIDHCRETYTHDYLTHQVTDTHVNQAGKLISHK